MSLLKSLEELEEIWKDFDKLYFYFRSNGKFDLGAERKYSFTDKNEEKIDLCIVYQEFTYDRTKYRSGLSVQKHHVDTKISTFTDFYDTLHGYIRLPQEPRSNVYKFIDEILSTEIEDVKEPESE